MYKPAPPIRSREGQILRFMREERKLSLPAVALKTGIKASVIDHLENGRKNLTEKEIETFLNCYNYEKEILSELLEIKLLNKQMANLYFLKHKD